MQLLMTASSAYDNGFATVVEMALTTGEYYAIEDCSVSVIPLVVLSGAFVHVLCPYRPRQRIFNL